MIINGTPIDVIADHHALHSLLTMLGGATFLDPRKTLYWSHIEIFSPHQPFLPTKHLPLWLLPLNIAGAHLCAPLDLAQVNLESQCTYKIASWLPVFVRLASLKTRQVPKLEIFVGPPISEESFHNGVQKLLVILPWFFQWPFPQHWIPSGHPRAPHAS